jgi:hypothetical protein
MLEGLTGQHTSRRILVDNLNSAAGAVVAPSRIQDDRRGYFLTVFLSSRQPRQTEKKAQN